MNEVFVMISVYFTCLFTEYVGDVTVRYQLGSFFVDMLLIMFLLNQIAIVYEISTCLSREYHSYRNKEDWKDYLQHKHETVLVLRDIVQNSKELDTKYSYEYLMKCEIGRIKAEINFHMSAM